MTEEEWRDVPSYKGYYLASSFGQVWSVKSSKLLKSGFVSGYPMVVLCKDGAHKDFYVHRLVLLAFVGPPPKGHECNHKNGTKTDNRPENLEWVLPSENIKHSIEVLGHSRTGSDGPGAKLTEDDVREIRRLYKTGKWNQYELANIFGVSQPAVSNIVRRTAWASVQ